jgi:hypothetical protein
MILERPAPYHTELRVAELKPHNTLHVHRRL